MAKYFNNKSRKGLRKNLRNNMPNAEIVFWSKIKNKQLSGLKFRRQQGIGPYVVDFYCPELKLAIEIDGDSHFQEGSEEYDKRRQKYIEKFNIKFLRFTNTDVYENMDGVAEVIYETVLKMNS